MPPLLDLKAETYTPSYCEENIFLLCRKLFNLQHRDQETNKDANETPGGGEENEEWNIVEVALPEDKVKPADKIYAVFISNETKITPLARQRTSSASNGYIVWDYHVVLPYIEYLGNNTKKSWIYDLDTTLDFPCEFETYVREALPAPSKTQPQRFYRVVPANVFLAVFTSDRSHMMRSNGSWLVKPPSYPPIIPLSGATMNLASFISMTENTDSQAYGRVYDEKTFIDFVNSAD